MRINDIIVENRTDEAPQGMLKRAGLGIASKFGSGTASGKLQTGELANALRKEYDTFVGKLSPKFGNKPTTDTLLAFLKQKGYPTGEVQKYIDQEMAKMEPKTAPQGPGSDQEPQDAATAVDPAAGSALDQAAQAAKTQPQASGADKIKAQRDAFKQRAAAARANKRMPLRQDVHEAVIPNAVLNRAFMLAAAEAAATGAGLGGAQAGAQPDSGPGIGAKVKQAAGAAAGAAGSVLGKAVQGFKAGVKNPEGPGADADDSGEVKGTVNYQKLGDLFPEIDRTMMRRSLNKSLNNQQLSRAETQVLAQLMTELVKKDPQETMRIMNLLKQVKEV